MRQLFLLVILLLQGLTHAPVALAAELTLFDVPLRTASREEIRAAVTKAGGRLIESTRDKDNFNPKAIGLPGAEKLEMIYLDNKLVLAQYHLNLRYKDEEKFRKMLVAKYGQPKSKESLFSRSRDKEAFDQEFIDDGKYRWNFDQDMELVFTKSFGSRDPIFLTYVNKKEQEKLGRLVNEADKRAIEKEAASKKSVF